MLNIVLVGVLFGILIPSAELHPSRMMAPGHEMVDFINELNTTWKAAAKWNENEPFPYYTGLLLHQGRIAVDPLSVYTHEDVDNLPESFDARQKWPHCPTIGLIRDQGECGSCWAVAATEVMTDRVCIHSGGNDKVQISAEDLMSCCKKCGDGCRGSRDVNGAWRHYLSTGIVTGGDYGSENGCQPYLVPPHRVHLNCSASRFSPKAKVRSDVVDTPKCETTCRRGYDKSYEMDKRHATKIYAISNDEKQIKAEILRRGPVQAVMLVYPDFVCYTKGVYKHDVDDVDLEPKGHSVKILGWGTENGVPYWLAANSWNTEWGDKGFFKIRRGSNECSIEGSIVAGIPQL